MKTKLITTLIALAASFAGAQEIIPQADAMKGAAMAWLASADITDAPVTIDPDIKKPFAMKGGGNVGVLVVPETKLEKEIGSASSGITPIGQLWLRGVLPVLNGSSVTADKLRTVSIDDGGTAHLIPVLFLGLQNGTGGKELVIFSQLKTPLATLPLKQVEQEQKLPIEFSAAADSDKKSATVTMTIIGRLQTSFGLVPENG